MEVLVMKIKGKILPIFMAAMVACSVSVFAQAGGSAVPFLTISPDARASGRGETGTAIADDINAVYWNPAGLGYFDYQPEQDEYSEPEYKPFNQVALAFSPWLPQFNADLYYSNGTWGRYIEDLNGTVAVNLILMNLGEFTRTDAAGREQGTFTSVEFALGASYGTMIAEDLAAGVTLRYIQSNLTPTSNTQKNAGRGISGGFDFALLWKPTNLGPVEDRLSLGFNLQNVGPKMTYINESDPLPTTLRIGTAFKIHEDEFNKLTFAADFAKMLVYRDGTNADPVPKSFVTAWQNPGAEWATGIEYWYTDLIALRAGYFWEPAAIGDREYLNFGAGVKYGLFKLDFSYINTLEESHPLANTMRFSMLIDIP